MTLPSFTDRARAIARLRAEADSLSITTDEQADDAAEIVKIVRIQIAEIDGERKQLGKPLRDGIAALNQRAKQITEPLEAISKTVVSALTEYRRARQRIETARARVIDEAERRRARTAAERGNIDEAAGHLARAEKVGGGVPERIAIKGRSTTVYSVKMPRWDIVDIALVPGEYTRLDDAAVRRAMRAGVCDIPGLRLWWDDDTRIR